jgi:type I restriction-modification system DNA methylase subunit
MAHKKMNRNKNLGQTFTPDILARWILENLGYEGKGKIIDNSCGNGVFLLEAAQQIIYQDLDNELSNLYGWDIDPLVIEECKMKLNQLKTYDWRVEAVEDSLTKPLQNPDYQNFFDFVVGNPPYLHYNRCAAQNTPFFRLMKEDRVKLTHIYGINLHSTPENHKKYRPNPNLYAFFLASALNLLKENGKLAFILPQTLLMAGDLDVIRYHLAHYTTIQKIVIFQNQLFVNEEIKNKTVTTSSLILFIQKKRSEGTNKTAVIYHHRPNRSAEECIEDLKKGQNCLISSIEQSVLLKNAANWTFLKYNSDFIAFYDLYKKQSQSMDLYARHDLAKAHFDSEFVFDGGYTLIEKAALPKPKDKELNYEIAKLNQNSYIVSENKGYVPNIRSKKDDLSIRLRHGNQGYKLLDSSYKIVWSTKNASRFQFTERKIIWANNRLGAIGSENKRELLYLFAVLNSPVTFRILHHLLKIEGEKDFLLPLTAVKNFVRVPLITPENQGIKEQIIDLSEQLLASANEQSAIKNRMDDCVFDLYFKSAKSDDAEVHSAKAEDTFIVSQSV